MNRAQEAPSTMQFIEGFRWAVPTAFSDAVGACQFSRGDTLYSSPIAYQAWDEPFYQKVRGLECLQVLSPEAKPAPPSAELFESNWETEAQAQLFAVGEKTAPVQVSTTQGRIYTLLWYGDIRVLNPQAPVPRLPQTARELLKLITDRKHLLAPQVHVTIKDHVLKHHHHASHYFALPYDLCNEVLRTKYHKLLQGLADKLSNGTVGVLTMNPRRLNLPEIQNVAPTVELKVFAFSSALRVPDGSAEAILERLKDLLYIPQDKAGGTSADRFRIEAHGLFAAIA